MSRKNLRRAKKATKSRKATRKSGGRGRDSTPSPALFRGIDEARQLLAKRRIDDAVEVLNDLAKRYPRSREVLEVLLDVHDSQRNMWSYQAVSQRLTVVEPSDADAWLGLGGAAIANGQPATARRAFNHFLSHWPDSPLADDVRSTRDEIEAFLRAEASQHGVTDNEGFELLELHDEINFHLRLGDYDKVVSTSGRLLARWPTFAPALNNRSEALFRANRLEQAIADSRRVLEFDAGNFHALANLTRYLFLSGDFDQATEVAKQLKAAESPSPDLFVKKAEPLVFMSDWQGVLDALAQAERSPHFETSAQGALLYHLAGVAAANLGRVDDAKKYWRRALKLNPSLTLAQENLDDSRQPPGERHGAWAYSMDYWIPKGVVERLIGAVASAGPQGGKEAQCHDRVRRCFSAHPQLERMAPQLLGLGDPAASEFVVRLIVDGGITSLFPALREFALGQRGTDDLRRQAAFGLVKANFIPPGSVRMWVEGEWRNLQLFGFEILFEPIRELPRHIEPVARRAQEFLYNDDPRQAEELFDRIIELNPGEPSHEYNRATAIELQGRKKEALAIMRKLYACYPEYLFARTRLAVDAAERGEYEGARALLEPLLARKRFHLTEFGAMCMAYAQVFIAERKWEEARHWLSIWRDADPDDERIEQLESRMRGGALRRMLDRWNRA